jgi:exodeoxyribonuclease VII small subunit
MASKKDKNINLEQALGELESLVEEMESGDLPLEEAMKKFERGITLTRECQTALRDAEQKVEVLMKKAGGGEETTPFEAAD